MSLYMPYHVSLAALGLQVECRNDGDAGGGDGSPDVGAAGGAEDAPLDDSAQTTETPVEESTTEAAHAAADDDDEDDDLKDDAHRDKPYADDPDFKRLKTKARRLQRQLKQYRPHIEKLRAFGVMDRLDDVVQRAREFDRVAPLLRQQSESRQGGTSRADRAEWTPPAFDRDKFARSSNFPYDPNEPGAKWLLDYAEQNHNQYYGLFGVVRQMAGEISSLRQGHQSEQESKVTGSWRSALNESASKLPERTPEGIPVRQMFQDAVIGAYYQAKARGARLDPKAVCLHYLKEFKPTSKVGAAEAAKQRMAENNRALPSRQAFAGGTPTQARNRSQERIGDVTKRLLGGRRW